MRGQDKPFTVAELEAAGVRRISLATSLYRYAMTNLVEAAREVKDKRTALMVRLPIDPPHGRRMMRSLLSITVLVLLISATAAVPAAAAPDGQVTWGVHISLAPT